MQAQQAEEHRTHAEVQAQQAEEHRTHAEALAQQAEEHRMHAEALAAELSLAETAPVAVAAATAELTQIRATAEIEVARERDRAEQVCARTRVCVRVERFALPLSCSYSTVWPAGGAESALQQGAGGAAHR